jgi:hypothetical protein
VNVTVQLSFDEDGTRMDVGGDPTFFTYRQVLLMMGDSALDRAFDHQVLIRRQLAFDHERRPNDGYIFCAYGLLLADPKRRRLCRINFFLTFLEHHLSSKSANF